MPKSFQLDGFGSNKIEEINCLNHADDLTNSNILNLLFFF